jgi:hypothetical protein
MIKVTEFILLNVLTVKQCLYPGIKMKIKKLMKKMYKACIEHDTIKEKKLWLKALKKSLKGKNTHSIK